MSATVSYRLAAGLLLALWACDSSPTAAGGDLGSPQVSVRLEKSTYSFAQDSGVRSTIYNRLSVPIFAPMGEYVHIQQWSQNGWIDLGPWFFVDGLGPSFSIPAGDSLVPPSMNLGYLERAGTYRLYFLLWLDPQGHRTVAEEDRVAEFRVDWE
jgi:hypothetical protein